jgi:2,4-dienoyl-CoA reductase-like NADH-dependent reductase (Old Yellow Enzyme family)
MKTFFDETFIRLTNYDQSFAWKQITGSVHQYPTIFIAQLMHAGAISQFHVNTKAPFLIIPKGEKMAGYGGGRGASPIPAELSIQDIRNVVEGQRRILRV